MDVPCRLVATDLDGTLVRTDGGVSRRTLAALGDARRSGAAVVAVTGRPPRFVEPIIDQLGVDGLVVCANGALVLDLGRDAVVDHAPLAGHVAATLVEELRGAAPGCVFAAERVRGYVREPAYRPVLPPPDEVVGDILELVADDVTKLMVKSSALPHARLLEIARRLVGDRGEVTHSGVALVEISAPGVHKGRGLAAVAGHLGLACAGAVAFGDAPNDLEMLRLAGRGVAMANAHDEVLRVADEVTASNDDDGVALVLERMFAA